MGFHCSAVPPEKLGESATLAAQMAAFLRGGGAITALNWAGKPVGVATEDLPDLNLAPVPCAPPAPVPAPSFVLPNAAKARLRRPGPSPAPVPAPIIEEPPVVAAVVMPARSTADLIADLRALRRAAQDATAVLDRLFA